MCVLSMRIELSNYSDIRELVVDSKPGFSPRDVSIIMGKSGSGKTLLANAHQTLDHPS